MIKMTNKKFTEDEFFVACCKEASVDPTMRQASKFRNKKGSAYRVRMSVKKNDESSVS
jgi:hypothetical protein